MDNIYYIFMHIMKNLLYSLCYSFAHFYNSDHHEADDDR